MARRIEVREFVVKYLEYPFRLSSQIGFKISQQVFIGAQPSVCPLHILDGWFDFQNPCNHFSFKWTDDLADLARTGRSRIGLGVAGIAHGNASDPVHSAAPRANPPNASMGQCL